MFHIFSYLATYFDITTKMKVKYVIILALALLTARVTSQESYRWDIETCIDYAIANNIQVKQGINNMELSRLELQQAKFDYLPSLSASAGYNANFGRALDPTTYQYVNNQTVNNINGSVALGTQVFAGMLKLHTMKRNEFNLLASMQNVERIKNEIILAVAAAYLQVLYNKEQIATSQSQIESLNGQIEHTRILFQAGSVTMGNLLELEAQLSQEEYNLVSYRNDHTNAILTLTQLLELRDVPGFDIVKPNIDDIITQTPESDVDNIYRVALDLPQIKVEELRSESALKDVSIAKSRLYPTLNFNASYGSSYSDARQRPQFAPDGSTYYEKYPFFDQFGDNASSMIGLNMSIPIFNSLRARRNVSVAKTLLRNQDLALDLAKDRLYKEIQQAYTDATGALNRFRSAESSVRNTQEAFRYAEIRYNARESTSVDYNVAKNNLINAKSLKIQAKYEYVFKMKILDFYRGVKITL